MGSTRRPWCHWMARIHEELAFTVIELLVVIAILGVLIGIAMPVFLGAQHVAEDRKVQADLRTALAASLTFFAEAGIWDAFDAAQGDAAEPSLSWVDGAPPTGREISIAVHAGQELVLVSRSTSGTFFCVAQLLGNPATDRGSGASFAAVDTVVECTGGW